MNVKFSWVNWMSFRYWEPKIPLFGYQCERGFRMNQGKNGWLSQLCKGWKMICHIFVNFEPFKEEFGEKFECFCKCICIKKAKIKLIWRNYSVLFVWIVCSLTFFFFHFLHHVTCTSQNFNSKRNLHNKQNTLIQKLSLCRIQILFLSWCF